MSTIIQESHNGFAAQPRPDNPVPTLRGSLRRVAIESFALAAAFSQNMSILDHLEELRNRILKALGFLALTFVVCWIFKDALHQIVRTAIDTNAGITLAIIRPQDIFNLEFRIALVAAIFLASPFLLTQAWLFISPALYPHERRYAIPFVLSSSALFIAGGAFGYFVGFPMTLGFLIQWILDSQLTPIIDAIEYFNLFFAILLALGIVFQMPAVVFVLSRIGLVNARFLLRNMKYAAVAVLGVAALISPPDIISMFAIAAPMIVLYVLSIGVAWLFGRERRKS